MKIFTWNNYNNANNKYQNSFCRRDGEIKILPQFKKQAEAIIAEYGDEYGKKTPKAIECVEKLCELQGTEPPNWVTRWYNKQHSNRAF